MTPAALGIVLLPVLLFLAGLMLMDSYKLVAGGVVLRAVAAGVVAALLALLVNLLALRAGISARLLQGVVAPAIEETLKALYVVYLMRTDRVGFTVDAGIQGFAVGAGFALLENLYYALTLPEPNPMLWLARGLGTAVMHGCATALVGIVSKDLADRHGTAALRWFAPGLAIAIVTHAAFNLLTTHAFVSVAVMLVGMPLLLVGAFERSEQATREWLGTGLDADVELLELILSGEISGTRAGRYLESLKHRFPGPVVADMLCLLQIHLELSLRAKGMLIARAAGLDVPMDRDVKANLKEIKYLERSIGPTGRIAILPLRRAHGRDLWQIRMMQKR